MHNIEKNIKNLSIELPNPAPPAATYVPYVISGNNVYISGQIPFLNGEQMHIGKVGENYSSEEAKKAAMACGLNILSQLKSAINGDWGRVVKCIKLGGFVNCTASFNDHPLIINAASELMINILGEEIGKHTRFAVGAPSLPFGVAVEIDAIFEIKE